MEAEATRAQGQPGRRHVVINGVPVTIVEHKNPKDGGAIDRGVIQLRRYEKETPELIRI
jgi:type I site-specific restriction-modification system R (restriction) subunit